MTPTPPLEGLFPTEDQIPRNVRRAPDDAGLTLLVDGRASRLGRPARRDPLGGLRARRRGRLERLPLGPGALASAELAREARRGRGSRLGGRPGRVAAGSDVASASPACSSSCGGRGRCASRWRAR